MTARTLEDLRQAEEAAWLWDGARGRVVWANAAGLALFGAQSLFDLVDQSFDRREDGLIRLKELSEQLVEGQCVQALLHFPSTGQVAPLDCQCRQHVLADGRPGVLVVAAAAEKPIDSVPLAEAQVILQALPQAVILLSSEGAIMGSNDAAHRLFELHPDTSLDDLFADPTRLARLRGNLSAVTLINQVEKVRTWIGLRDARVTAIALPQGLALVLEDVTERRALERQLMEKAEQLPEVPPKLTSKDQAFAQLAESLHQELKPKPVETPPLAATKKEETQVGKLAPKPDVGIPDGIRRQLDGVTSALYICRHGQALFANAAALTLLERSLGDILADPDLCETLSQSANARGTVAVSLPSGREITLSVERKSLPWLSGRADQLTLTKGIEKSPLHAPQKPEPEVQLDPTPANVLDVSAPVEPPWTEAPNAPSLIVGEPLASDDAKAILDVATDGIVTLDETGAILSFSAGAEAIFGHPTADVVGKPLAELLSDDSKRSLRDYLAALNGPGLASVFNDGREVTAIVKQGGSVPLFLTIGRLQSTKSRAKFCVVLRDITAWKRTEHDLLKAKEEAEIANRQKSEFLARISHELRTPLNAIMGFSEVMRLERFGELKNERYRAYAHDIHSSGAHLLALINDLLDLSKVEAGKLELNFTAVSLSDVADHAITMLQQEAATARVLVRKSISQSMPRVVADLKALRQIMLNLISNAIKYTDAGGEVIVSAAMQSAGALSLTVKDTGIGMTAAEAAEALRPFTRVEVPGRERQGTGLGLPLTKALAEANRAGFALFSERGQGTRVDITFPVNRVLAD